MPPTGTFQAPVTSLNDADARTGSAMSYPLA